MKPLYVLLILGFLGLAACDLESDCSGTVSATYTVGQDVTAEFDVTEAEGTALVLTSDCEALPAGKTAEEIFDRIQRVGDAITVTEGEESVEMTVADGTTIQAFTRTQTIAGCEITVLLSGTLNEADETIETSGSFAAKGLTCDQAL